MKSELVPANGDPPIPITKDVTVIGRRESCDVVVPHPSLSKRHCVLVRTEGLLIVRDLASTNGTKVNGQKVMWAALLPNDRVTLGRVKFKVYLGSDEAPSPSDLGRRGAKAAPAAPARPAAPTGFAPPSTPAVPVPPSPRAGPTDADDEVEILDESDVIVDEDREQPFIIELD